MTTEEYKEKMAQTERLVKSYQQLDGDMQARLANGVECLAFLLKLARDGEKQEATA